MFTAKRQVATVVGNCLRMLPGSPVAGQRILMYHAVGNRVDGDINNIYTMSRTDFLRHIETLQAVSAKHNMPFAPFRQSNNTEIAITFDDGYADALSTIGPELSKRGIPFHVFVTPEKLTSGDQRYLSTPELRELATIPGATIEVLINPNSFLPSGFGGVYSSLSGFIESCPSCSASVTTNLNNAIAAANATESQFASNSSTLNAKISAANLLRKQKNEKQLQIWGYRGMIGQLLVQKEEYQNILTLFDDPTIKQIFSS